VNMCNVYVSVAGVLEACALCSLEVSLALTNAKLGGNF
jgi:hypothetical protein